MTIKEQLEILKSPICICGKRKKYRHAFCRNCFASLPQSLQQDLYNPIPEFGHNYERALNLFRIKIAHERII